MTTPEATLVAIARGTGTSDLARACHEAGVRFGTTPAKVDAVVRRRPRNLPGRRKLLAILQGDVHVTLSKLESGFLALLRKARLPLPKTNRPAGSHYVDCRWPEHRLTVELDSYRYHRSRYAWEQSYQREREARAREDEWRRFTWGDVFEDPRYMLAALRKLLGGR